METTEPNFRPVFEACPHPHLVLSPDSAFTIIGVDDRYLEIIGANRADVLGRGLFDVFPDTPREGAATGLGDLRVSLERALRERARNVMGVRNYAIPRDSVGAEFGVEYWTSVNTPVLSDDGSVAMIIHHLENITPTVPAGEGDFQTQTQEIGGEAEAPRHPAELKDANHRVTAMFEEREPRARSQRKAGITRMDKRLKDLDRAKSEMRANVFHRIPVPRTRWRRYALAIAIFAASLALRLLVLPAADGLPFVTFYPATVITVFLYGVGPGLLSALFGLLFGYFVFMPPFWAVKFAVADLPVLAVYAACAVAICAIIDRVLRAAGTMSAINRQLAATMSALELDIAERQRTERALRDSEEGLRSLFENAAIGTAIVGLDWRCLQANPAFAVLMGYTRTELSERTLQNLTHPDDLELDGALARDLLDRRRHSYRVEKRFFRKGGEIVWVLVNVSLMRDEGGAPVHFIVQIQDMSEIKRAEEKAQRQGRIVAMMSKINQAIIHAGDEQSLYQAVCDVVVDEGGYRMAWMGLVEEDEAKTIRPMAHAGHEDGYLVVARISWGDGPWGKGPSGMAVRTGRSWINNDFKINPVMGPWREPALERGYQSSISLPLKDRLGVFGVLTLYGGEPEAFGPEEVALLEELAEDVSYGITALRTRRDHDELERTLFQAQKMESLGQLTGGIAHDFNNLLHVVISNLDLSLSVLGGSSAIAGYLHNAMAGAERGAELTARMLAFARRQPLRPEPLRVDRLVAEMTNLLRRTLGETIDIELVTSGGLWTALVDSNQLQNALLNLAINARDAMPKGGKLTIELANVALDPVYASAHREVRAGQYVMVGVTDTGTGISPEILDRVFEPFFTTKPEGQGTGLGLSMVYGFAKQSGGHIKVYSEIGHGTAVKLYVPRSRLAERRRAVEKARIRRGGGETILVAEDDDGVRASVVAQLTELGYRVLAVANGEAALEVLTRGLEVDLLFTDVVMPGAINGRALADKAQTLRPGLPVVFTSGYTENAIIHHGRLDEGVTLLSKPYRLAQLAGTIRTAVERPGSGVAPPMEAEKPQTMASDAQANPSSVHGHILVVEDDELVRMALAESLQLANYRALAVERPSEALSALAEDPRIQILISDFSLPEMNGVALAREALVRHPKLRVILASGHQLDGAELPDSRVRIITKPFHPLTLQEMIEAALG